MALHFLAFFSSCQPLLLFPHRERKVRLRGRILLLCLAVSWPLVDFAKNLIRINLLHVLEAFSSTEKDMLQLSGSPTQHYTQPPCQQGLDLSNLQERKTEVESF